MNHNIGRRKFLGIAGLGAGAASLSAFTGKPSSIELNPNLLDTPVVPGVLRRQEATDWQEIDRLHKLQVDTFVENIGKDANFWRTPLEFTMSDDGFKEFEIVCQEVDWETEPGSVFPAFTYNGMVPGPEFRVTEGDKVRVKVKNEMGESTGIHFHGLIVPNEIDGVPFVTQPPIEPGAEYVYEFEAVNPGSHMYHSHHNAAEQVIRGLLGAFIIEPADKSHEPQVDAEYVMILNDSGLGYTINGKSFPYTQPLVAKQGQRVRIRYMNEGLMIHPMHLHGMPQLVIAKDGYPLPQPYLGDTVNIAPGERYDVLVDAEYPGLWAFHCHILTHAESRRGLYGMTTVFVVEE
ncbi:MAG TPA: multicopper oxidase domain-containing protein [Aggregatilineales bacterium]|nr:multicopper oxidase domain-containing protein [Aggregatilineales bacterium]